MKRVIQYAEAVGRRDPAISGQGGHSRTFAVACNLLRAFPWLSESQLLAALQVYSTYCRPEWSIKELTHKARSAIDRTLGGRP